MFLKSLDIFGFKSFADKTHIEFADGITIGDFLDDWRIRHAATLLRDSDEPVGIVAEMSGFRSRSHFNTLFRDKFKLTPSEYSRVAKEKK